MQGIIDRKRRLARFDKQARALDQPLSSLQSTISTPGASEIPQVESRIPLTWDSVV